ncbi:MAG: hypothetical protein HY092_00995 [Candidatus Kerfeldbacteria bacterium]|nr:hypothetical protein [Candidatus Kerfeldbacteria bacterium]
MLLFLTILRVDRTHPRFILALETTKYPVPIFGEFIVDVKKARFVEQDKRPINDVDLARRMWKYYGPEGTDVENLRTEEDLIAFLDREPQTDPTYHPLEGFWGIVSGKITDVLGSGFEDDDPECLKEAGQKQITGIAAPGILLEAELVEFEVDPRHTDIIL